MIKRMIKTNEYGLDEFQSLPMIKFKYESKIAK